MNLFSKLPNENMFKALTGKNKHIYLDCLEVLYHRSQLGVFLTEEDAKDYINELLRKTPMVDDPSEMISESKDATGVITYLRNYGWINETEIGNNYEKIIKLPVEAMDLINCFSKIANSETSSITATGDVINAYNMIVNPSKMAEYDESPYELVLKTVVSIMDSLVRAFKNIEDRVKNAAVNVKLKETIDNVLVYACNGKEDLFPDYFKLKNNGNIAVYISMIKDSLGEWYENGKIELAIKEYMIDKKVSLGEATKEINELIQNIYIFFNDRYPMYMAYLDTKTEDYFNSILVRLYFLSAGSGEKRIETIRELLNYVKENESETLEELNISTLKEFKYLSSDSAKVRRLTRKEEIRQVATTTDFSEEEKEKIREKFQSKINQKSLRDKVENFVQMAKDKDVLSPNDMPITSEEDSYLYSALFCVYSGARKNQAYEVVKTEGKFENEYMICDNFELRKKV